MILSRRDLLQGAGVASAAAILPSWMPRLAFRARGQAARGDVLVVVFLRGGMDGLSAVVPYQERNYYDSRRGIAFAAPKAGDAKSTIRLDDRFALNPALVSLKSAWDDGQLAVVHATGMPDPTRSHFDAMDYMERGTPGASGITTGWLGRHLEVTAKATDSPFRAIGWGAMLQQSLRGPVPAAALQSIADFHLQGRPGELAAFRQRLQALYGGGDWFDETAVATFEALDLLERADPSRYQPEGGATYADTHFGQGLKQIAQLIKADVGLEVACIDLGGWDTHTSQVWGNTSDPTRGAMFNLLRELDQGLGAFHRDLGRRFADPGVTLVTMSEFGRRVAQNAANGTDHGHGNCIFVLSGAAQPGMHVQWPGLEPADLEDGDLAITIDYRDILAEILFERLGNEQLDEVFPGHTPVFHGVVRDSGGAIPNPTATAAPAATATPVPTLRPGERPERSKIYLPQVRKRWPDFR